VLKKRLQKLAKNEDECSIAIETTLNRLEWAKQAFKEAEERDNVSKKFYDFNISKIEQEREIIGRKNLEIKIQKEIIKDEREKIKSQWAQLKSAKKYLNLN
jgi:hypothetical protein